MKKKFNGFTLIEMIIVVALFGLIMAGALSLLQPIRRVYNDAFDFEGSRATVNNVRQFVEDNVKYANRLIVLTNCNDINTDLSTIANITEIADDGNGISSGDGINAVELMRSRYMLGTESYSFSGNPRTRISRAEDEVYVIYIDNPEREDPTIKFKLNDYVLDNTNRGQVTYQVYRYDPLNPTPNPLPSETKISNEALYDEYSLVANLGELITDSIGNPILDSDGFNQYENFRPQNFAITLEIYKNKINSSGSYDLENTHVNSVITFSLVNIFPQGTHQKERITFSASGAENITEINRYSLIDCQQSTNDIILVFTKPPRL